MPKLYSCFFLLFIFSSLCLKAQHDLKYDSLYTNSAGTEGTAKFDYYYDLDHLKVKNGKFLFNSKSADTAWHPISQKQSWEGQFNENKKDGLWTYHTISHDLEVLSIEDDHLEYKLETIKTELKAEYKKGVPTGTWRLNSQVIFKNKKPEFHQQLEISFKKGLADGFFKNEFRTETGRSGKIEGNFSKGLFIGKWDFVYEEAGKEIKETRNYSNGILLSLSKTVNGESKTLTYPISPQTKKVLNEGAKSHLLNKPYSINSNDGYPSRSNYIKDQVDANNFLIKAHKTITQFDTDFLRKNKFIFGANRGFYPLNEEEKKAIAEWFVVEQEFHRFVENTKVKELQEFGESTDSIALATLAWVEHQESLFDLMSSLSDIFLSKEIEYYYRDSLILQNTIQFLDFDTLTIRNKQYIIEYRIDKENKTNAFKYLAENFKSRQIHGQKIYALLSKIQSSSSLEEELEKLPKRIKAEQTKLDSLVAPLSKYKDVTELVEHIKVDFLETDITHRYEEFVSTKNKDLKKQLGDSILVDLYTIENLYSTSILLVERNTIADSLYTEYVFDAFTFSDNVPSRIKKKLYDQITDITDDLVRQARLSKTPNECLEILQEIYHIQGVLIYLKDQNTKALEKSLSRAKTLEDKLKLLHEVL